MCSFFSLPRELRAQIYELSLVREEQICVVEINLETKSSKPELQQNIRTTWHGGVKACTGFEIDLGSMTYQMLPMKVADKPCLNLFLTSRRTYCESRETYYSQNKFSFGNVASIAVPALLAFLYDRPLDSLQYIRDLEMCLYHVSYFEMVFWEALCEELDRHLSLRYLRVQLRTSMHELITRVQEDDYTCEEQHYRGCLWAQEIRRFGEPKVTLQLERSPDHGLTVWKTLNFENPIGNPELRELPWGINLANPAGNSELRELHWEFNMANLEIRP